MGDWKKRNARALLKELQAHGLAVGVQLQDFRGEDLRGQTFEAEESLAGADFRGATLQDAHFVGVDLGGADLSHCDLLGARLDRAILTGASLDAARLDEASLIGADLRQARLAGTSWRRARLVGAQLSEDVTVAGWGMASPGALPRLQIPSGGAQVTAAAWQPSGELIAIARAHDVQIWDAEDFVLLALLTTPGSGDVTAAAWSPHGSVLATAASGSVRLWDVGDDSSVDLHGPYVGILSLCWSPDGGQLATGGYDGYVRVWDASGLEEATRLDARPGAVRVVSWSPDGTRLAAGADDGIIRLWEFPFRSSAVLHSAVGSEVDALGWAPDGNRLAGAHRTGSIRLWDLGRGTEPEVLTPEGSTRSRAVAWSPDGTRLATANDHRTMILNPATGAHTAVLEGTFSHVSALGWSPDGARLITGSLGVGEARVWDVDTAAPVATLATPNVPVSAVAWSPDGTKVAIADGTGTIRVWTVDPASPVEHLYLESGRPAVRDLLWSPDGRLLASSHYFGIQVWDAGTGARRTRMDIKRNFSVSQAWSPDSRTLAVGLDTGEVHLMNVGSGESLATRDVHRDWVRALAWAPGGASLISAGDDSTLRLWDGRTGEARGVVDSGDPYTLALAWSSDGHHLAAGSIGRTAVWATKGWDVVARLQRVNQVTQLAWRDGQLAALDRDMALTMWDLPGLPPSGRWRKLLPTPLRRRLLAERKASKQYSIIRADRPTCTALSPDWRVVAAGYQNGSVRLLPTGSAGTTEAKTLLGLPNRGYAVFFGEHLYRLEGDPEGWFWWTSGLCRFDPGELDGYGVARL